MFIARYGYAIGGTHAYNWFWIRDEYTPNERSNAERFPTREAAHAAATEAVANGRTIQPHIGSWRIAVEEA